MEWGRRKRKVKELESELESEMESEVENLFPLLLAAVATSAYDFVRECLRKLRVSLLSKRKALPIPILSMLPILLKSRDPRIASHSAGIVGAASLHSLQLNEQIALDAELVKAVIWGLHGKNKVSKVACNAILDLCTSSVGRHRLLEFFRALEVLIRFEFLQVPFSPAVVSLSTEDSRSVAHARIVFKEGGHLVSLLQASIILINTCVSGQLEKIPKKLSEKFLVLLRGLWQKVRNQILLCSTLRASLDRHFLLSNITVNNIAESIFRLSTNSSQFIIPFPSEIFGWDGHSFKTFIADHWEVSPSLVRRHPRSLSKEDEILRSFGQSLNCMGSSPLSTILQSFIFCVPIASDELDILRFLEDVRNELGCPIVYHQDIRVLRTEKQSKDEVHLFHKTADPCYVEPFCFNIVDIMKCEEAYKAGYTIALCGLEFRFASIAAVADALASLFGQPSVRANMYLTPPNSQGLARHSDDHCVFVYQLFGAKEWTIFSSPNVQLPHLYDPLDNPHGSVDGNLSAACTKFLLKEGDILYIPRGFPHEACTDDVASSDSARFSLHITFSIEVEPPFEWEGFAHVALDCWYQGQKQAQQGPIKLLSGVLNLMSVNMLHAMIELVGASDPILRKACLVAAVSFPLDNNDWLLVDQKAIFNEVIGHINKASMFLEVVKRFEAAAEKNVDPFERMTWLKLLYEDRETIQGDDWIMSLMGVENLLTLYAEHKDVAEAAFVQIKSKFCDEVLFENTMDTYKMLLEKYKKGRKQYMNGMLSLHGN